MMNKSKWPESVIFWGAGATSDLGFPPTGKQGEMLISLSEISCAKDYYEKLKDYEFFTGTYLEEMADLLFILDDDAQNEGKEYRRMVTTVTDSQLEKAKELFDLEDEQQLRNLIVNLRYNYDFSALKQMLKLCTKDKWSIVMSVFNLIDYHMGNNEGFFVKSENAVFIEKHRLMGARNALIMLIVSTMTGAYLNALDSKRDSIQKYKKFAKDLATYMRHEGNERIVSPQNSREFYLFSYAIISLNWDHFLNWMIFHAHKDFNDDENNDSFAGRHRKLKFFNDFSILMGLRELKRDNGDDELSTKIWYPYNESVVQRINDPDYDYAKIVRIGKYYYPHGCVAWRCCPNCGSMTGTFGDLWSEESKSLFPPSLIPSSRKISSRSKLEEEWVKQGWYDAIECSYCGAKTELKDTPLIMQTAVKSNIPPVLRMIQSEINACLENTKHIIFMGFSLPSDDLVWRSILLARKGDVKVSVVLGTGGPNRWQTGSSASEIIGGKEEENKRFFDLFGPTGLRFNTHGIPNVFDGISIADLLVYD